MKLLKIIIWLLLSQAAMGLSQLDTENADRDLTSQVTVLTHTPSTTVPMQCQGLIYFGDGVKNLSGGSGTFRVEITIGGQTLQPNPQSIYFTTATRSCVYTSIFPVPANAEVIIKAFSPAAADTDVDVTAYLYDVGSVNVAEISGDSTAADNLELMYDGTGYIDDSAPASRDQIASLGGALSIKVVAESSTVTQGTETLTYAATATDDGSEYVVTDDGAGAGIDFYLQFDIGTGNSPIEFHLHGYYNEGVGATNALYIQAYNSNTATYDTIETLTNSASAELHELSLATVHVDASDKVKIKFLQAAQEGSSAMHIDHAEVGYASSPVTAAEMADAVWDEAVADHTAELAFGGEVGGLDPNITLILADTDELQTDWTDGGRLDLLLDAIKAITDRIPLIVTTVDTPNDANEFFIASAADDSNDAYVGSTITIQDVTDSHYESRYIVAYTGSTREVSVDLPFTFTPAASDPVWIWSVDYLAISLFDAIARLPQVTHVIDTIKGGVYPSSGTMTRYDQFGDDP